ncbi:LysE family transporter [Gordonia sp. NB41Y]|uniref:LysE family transporter n=1 Tax=Gordonia sp. NB41Y TaxID=875808 RepID=UPI0002BD89A0|nr:LysE family transporter [Gordonia sp. NB41Y]EMP11883.1 lysine transporter LysE [Gordonia sp. NB41Y]WLP90683.1 LysE family transporter [Gordonia sp. NB41Y]
MSLSSWSALLAACLLISFTPGAGAIYTMSNAINVGHRRTIWGVLGLQAALIIQLAIVAAGLGVVVAGSPTAFAVIRYLGAAYLVYLGIRQILRTPVTATDTVVGDTPQSAGSLFVRGVGVNLLNPKAIVFFLAFIPGFVKPEHGFVTQYAMIGATIVAVDIAVMWLFFAVVGRGFARLTGTVTGQRRLNRIFGALFIGVGILLAVV